VCWLLVGAEENQVRGASDGGIGVYGKDSKDDVYAPRGRQVERRRLVPAPKIVDDTHGTSDGRDEDRDCQKTV
jgi:hypothetical protein